MSTDNSIFSFADKFGFKSPFQDNRQEPDLYFEGAIDYQKLCDTIKGSNHNSFPFNYEDYVSGETADPAILGFADQFSDSDLIDKPLVVTADDGSKARISVKGRLNKNPGAADTKDVYNRINIDAVKKELTLTKVFYYVSGVGVPTPKIVAIELTCNKIQDYLILSSYIQSFSDSTLREKFAAAFEKFKGSPGELNFLFENASGYVLRQFDDETLWQYLLDLLTYDESSGKKDSSTAVMNILTCGFSSPEFVYNKLNPSPELVIRIYDNMDNGNTMPFCQLLTALSFLYSSQELEDVKRISKGKGYRVHEYFPDNGDDKRYVYLESSKSVHVNIARLGLEPKWPTYQLLPMEIVELYDLDKKMPQYMCALALKKLAADEEWEALISFAVNVLTIISFFTSAGILIRGASLLLRIAAVTDIATITISQVIRIPAVKDFLDDSEEGRWFLANWDTINMVANLGVMSPMLTQGIIENGPKVILSIKNSKQFLLKEGKQVLQRIEELLQKAKGLIGKVDDVEEDVLSLFRRTSADVFDDLGGRILSLKEIKSLRRYLTEKYGVKLKLVDKDYGLKRKLKDWNNRGIVGSFNPRDRTIYLRSTVSELTVFHEMAHLKIWNKLTPAEYAQLQVWEDETYVWGQIWKTKSKWANKELVDSYKYVNDIRRKAGVKEIQIDEMEKLEKLKNLNLL